MLLTFKMDTQTLIDLMLDDVEIARYFRGVFPRLILGIMDLTGYFLVHSRPPGIARISVLWVKNLFIKMY